MTHALAIARREIEERLFVILAAVAAAVVPFVAFLFPNTASADRQGAMIAIGFLVAVGFTWGLAVLLGTTLVGRELSERRLSFYFSRPVSGAAIWFGKLIGATTLLVVSFLIVHAIPFTFGQYEWRTMSTHGRGFVAAGVLAIAIALMLVAHVVSTWARSRSPLLALDFGALLAFIALAILAITSLAFAGARTTALDVIAVLLLALVVAAGGGGAWQLSRGRVDARRSHRALSAFVWTTLAIGLAIAATMTVRAITASPHDFTDAVFAMQHGNVVEVEGRARGTYQRYSISLVNGAYVLEPGYSGNAAGDVVVSLTPARTLRTAMSALASGVYRSNDVVLTVRRMVPEPRVLAQFTVSWFPEAVAVSADGQTLAYVEGDSLVVYDIPSKKSLAARLPVETRGGSLRTAVLPGGSVRVCIPQFHRDSGWVLRVADFDPRSRKWQEASTLQLHDGSAYVLSHGGVITPLRREWTWVMRDGRLAVSEGGNIDIRRGDVVERRIAFPGATGATAVAEVGSGKLLVSVRSRRTGEAAAYVADANTGAIGAPMNNVRPAIETPFAGATATQPRLHALIHRDTGRIDVMDTQTGAIRPLL